MPRTHPTCLIMVTEHRFFRFLPEPCSVYAPQAVENPELSALFLDIMNLQNDTKNATLQKISCAFFLFFTETPLFLSNSFDKIRLEKTHKFLIKFP